MTSLATFHARTRMDQRGLSDDDIAFVRHYGSVIHRTGVKFYFLGKRDIPRAFARSHGHLEGITLVVSPDRHVLVTCYRNRGAIAEIKRKSKRNHKAA